MLQRERARRVWIPGLRWRVDPVLRGVFATMTSTGAARVITSAGMFALVPWLLGRLGVERYGRWTTAVSALALVPALDFGVGWAALTRVAQAFGRGDQGEVKRTAQSALFMLCVSSTCVALAAILVTFYHERWSGHASTWLPHEALVGILIAIVGIPASLGSRMLLAAGRGPIAGLCTMAGSCLTLLGMLATTYLGFGVAGLAVSWGVGLTLANVASLFVALRTPAIGVLSFAHVSRAVSGALARDARWLSILQVCSWLTSASDPLLISAFQNDENAARYALTQQLLSLPTQALALASAPLWAAFSMAHGRNDGAWISALLPRALLACVLCGAFGCTLLAWFSPWISRHWAHERLLVEPTILLGFVATGALNGAGLVLSTFFNAVGALRPQVFMALGICVSLVCTKVLVLRGGSLRLLPWLFVASYTLFALIPYCALLPRYLRAYASPQT